MVSVRLLVNHALLNINQVYGLQRQWLQAAFTSPWDRITGNTHELTQFFTIDAHRQLCFSES